MQKSATTTESSSTHTYVKEATNYGFLTKAWNKLFKTKNKELKEYHSSSPHQDTKLDDITAVNEQYKDTPLWIRGNGKDGYFITMGNERISETFTNYEQAVSVVKRRDWNLLLNVIALVSQKIARLTPEDWETMNKLGEAIENSNN